MKKLSVFFVLSLFIFPSQMLFAEESKGLTNIRIDGSSTVYLLTEAVAEEFQKGKKDVRLNVGISGTGGGLKKFTNNEIDIANASRKIEAKEITAAEQNKVKYTEFQVAYDGIAVVVNPKNTFLNTITVEDLKKIWEKDSKVKYWSDVNKAWPKEEIKLYGPGAASGTFDYFTKAINGEEKAIRPDFTASENDDVLVAGVAGDKNGLGYFGYAYYRENKDKLKLVGLSTDGGKTSVSPTPENIKDGRYKPLSRPLFIYVNNNALKQQKIKDFVAFYLNNAASLAPEVGYVALDEKLYKEQTAKLK